MRTTTSTPITEVVVELNVVSRTGAVSTGTTSNLRFVETFPGQPNRFSVSTFVDGGIAAS